MPRRIDLEARRVHLAEAVWHVILQRGIGAVSVRTVAEEAGVAVGSLRHVFESRAELLQFSAELMVQRATERVQALVPTGTPIEKALTVLSQFLPLEPDSKAELEVNIALIAEARALPVLAEVRDRAHVQLREACRHVLLALIQEVGGRISEEQLQIATLRLHALIDGLAVHLMIRADEADGEWAVAILRQELESISAE